MLQVSRFPLGRPSCSEIISNTSDTKSAPRESASLSDYTSVIKDWPIPHTLKTLRAFLGKCRYYQCFIADYATISACPIHTTGSTLGYFAPAIRRCRCPSLPHHETEVDVRSHPSLPPVPRRAVHPRHGLQRRPGCHRRCPFPSARGARTSDCLWGSPTPTTGTELRFDERGTSGGDLFLTVL